MLVLDLRLDSDVALYQQIYEQIRAAILSGRLRSHQKLPSSRHLAQSLSVSRTTVTESYDQLISEGYLHTRKGAGTFVCAQIPESLLLSPPLNRSLNGVAAISTLSPQSANVSANVIALSDYAQRLTSVSTPSAPSDCEFSFRYWRPDLSLFPMQQWQRLVNRHSARSANWMTYSTHPMGLPRLREEIAAYIAQSRAVCCEPNQILITQGTQQAVSLVSQLLLTAGDGVAVENPGYLSSRQIFASYGAALVPVAVDEEGLKIDGPSGLRASAAEKRVRLVYVTPSHQFPTGALMTLSRRLALLQWAEQNAAWIVEDDYDSEFRYGGRPVPSLQGFDTQQSVLYVGTFSKVMFPGLRLGYVVLPPALVAVFERAKWLCDRQCSVLHQMALSDFIAESHLSRHIRRMRLVYERRRTVLINALSAAFEKVGPIEILGDAAGLHLMVRLPLRACGLTDEAFVHAAQQQGVDLFDVGRYCLPAAQSLRNEGLVQREGLFIFGFGGMDAAAIEAAIARLKPILDHSTRN